MKIMSVVGARPNFMKIAPFVHALASHNARGGCLEHVLVHTGQHYDQCMSASFFDALDIPRPDIDLDVGSGSHAEQVGRTMIALEKTVLDGRPDWIVVVGDVNATCAGALVAKKEHLKLAHIEAGLRSFDMDMPEEINRMVTDRLSDLLLTPDVISSENLRKEGTPDERINMVGNIMIDTLEAHREAAARLDIAQVIHNNRLFPDQARLSAPPLGRIFNFDFQLSPYAALTLHRPSNVDRRDVLAPLMRYVMREIAAEMPVVWPIHPRTKKQLEIFGLWEEVIACDGLVLLQPVGYREMLRLTMGAAVMLTDSGGLQEECCVLGTPCLTLRATTERPVTLREHGGTSVLVGNSVERMREAYAKAKSAGRRLFRPPLWDGKTAGRIVAALAGTG